MTTRIRVNDGHNRTVVIDARLGERENKQVHVVEAHGLRNLHIYEPGEEWIEATITVKEKPRKPRLF